MTGPTPSDEAVAAAGSVLARVLDDLDRLSPRQAAERAHHPGGPSVDELEDLIRVDRGLAPKHGKAEAA